MNVGGFVETEFNATSFGGNDGLGDIARLHNGASFGVRHQVAGTKHTTKTADFSHHVGGTNCDVKISVTALDASHIVIGLGYKICASFSRSRCSFALGKDQDTYGLAKPLGQHDHIANLLISLAGIQAGSNVNLNSLVEFRKFHFFY